MVYKLTYEHSGDVLEQNKIIGIPIHTESQTDYFQTSRQMGCSTSSNDRYNTFQLLEML